MATANSNISKLEPSDLGRDQVSLDRGRDLALARRRQLERSFADTRVLGGGRTFFHPENSRFLQWLLRGGLRVCGLLERGRRNAMDIQIRRNDISLERIPPAFDGFTLLHISDLHLDFRPDFPGRLSEAVAGLRYDVCVLTGDYRFHTDGDSGPALRALSVLRDALSSPVYAVLGNHDGSDMIDDMCEMGYQVLYNDAAAIVRGTEAIYLAGVDDPHFFQTDDLQAALRPVPEGATRLLLAHSPEIYRSAELADVDYLLCGHTHGGQIALPGGRALYTNARCPDHLVAGPWQWGKLKGYTSTGAGSSVLDVRFNCLPEVVLHRLCRPCQAGPKCE
jgi:predicted MPP superfamily phosphohydrolase